MMQRHRPIRFVAVAALAVLYLWPTGKLSGQARSDVAPREPLPGYAQSNGVKPGDGEAVAPVAPSRLAEEDKKLAPSTSAPSVVLAPALDKVQVTGLRFLSSKQYTRVMLDISQDAKYEVPRAFRRAYTSILPARAWRWPQRSRCRWVTVCCARYGSVSIATR
jgi:hypothetical protein